MHYYYYYSDCFDVDPLSKMLAKCFRHRLYHRHSTADSFEHPRRTMVARAVVALVDSDGGGDDDDDDEAVVDC